MSSINGAVVQIAGGTVGLESLSVELPLGGGEQGTLEAFGIDAWEGRDFTLTALRNGAPAATALYTFAVVRGPKSGSNGPLARTRGVTLQDYTALWNRPAGGREGLGMPSLPPRFRPVLYDIDKPLGSDLPDGSECEEKRRSAQTTAPGGASALLRTLGMDVLVMPGPGFVPRTLEDSYSTAGKTLGQVLGELLFTNGVRWWLEGDLVVVDGRALPVGAFAVPGADRDDVETESWEDDFADYEAEPSLSDYVGRCAENAVTDEGVAGTFETSPNGVYPYEEMSGSQGSDGDYERTDGTVTKAGGQIVRDESVTFGYLTTPGGRRIGRTKQTFLTNDYHPAVPQALVKTVERERVYADFGLLQNFEGQGQGSSELQLELWRQLQLRSPYVAAEKVTRQRWNAEGLLRAKTTTGREFAGLQPVTVGESTRLELLYKDSYLLETWLPAGGGQYWHTLRGYVMVDTPVYEKTEGDEASEPVGIMPVRQPVFDQRLTDSPPESVSIPLPSCEEMNDCLNQAQREYARDHADWRARQANGVSVRRHRVAFTCLKLNLRRGMDYGGGRILSAAHGLARKEPGGTNIEVVVAHAE